MPVEPTRETTRDRILATALQLFAERGYRGATTAEIAQQAGIAEGTIYRHFRDKKELFLACVEPAIEETFDRLLNARQTGPAPEIIRQSLAIRIAVMTRHPLAYNILFAESAHHPELADLLISRVLAPRHTQLTAVLRSAISDGSPGRQPNPIILSVGLTAAIWAILGIQRLAPAAFPGWSDQDPERLLADLTDFVLYGLIGQPPPAAAAPPT